MSEGLKQKTISGVVWSGIERFSTQGVQFIIEIVMARLLLPSDYGVIGMLAVFMALSRAFIDSGFSNALIQKTNRNDSDYSTVFYSNVVIALVVYLIIYFTSPLIALFYNVPELTLITRVFSLSLFISAFSAVSRTILVIKVDFKTQAKISLIAAFVSGIFGIYLALHDYGVWSLIWQSIVNITIQSILLFYYVKWKPSVLFSKDSFKSLFSFGSKLLVASLLSTLYDNLYTIVIGKNFMISELGYYTKSDQLVRLPSTNIAFIISRVSFPILATIQNDNHRLELAYKKYLVMSSLIVFPLMIGLSSLASPLILLLFTSKWMGMVLMLQILCFDWMWDPMSKININLLLVKGHSNLILRLEIKKRIVSITILFLTLPFGLIWLCIGRVIYSFVSVYINTYYIGKTIKNLDFVSQIRLVIPYFIISLLMGVVIYFTIQFVVATVVKLILGIAVGIVFYFTCLFIFKSNDLNEIIEMIKYLLKKKNNAQN